jgi:formate hydrogenlyase transcriptional activator
MSAVSNFATHIGGYRDITALNTTLCPPGEAIMRKTERTQTSVVETIVGRRGGLRAILAEVEAVAPTNATVLISGETGTGKEVIARAIHELSPRRSRNLIKVNCAAMPAGLLESELFGHERGAFTGAFNSHVGRFAIADRGTLFLDEIGDMPLELQPKLLRVLQEREFEAVGSTRTTKVDVRIVAATNRDLRQMVQDGEFREDLYYRLNIFPISLPPLRERKRDIPELVRYFVEQFATSMDKIIETISEETMRSVLSHSWPGNIRELQNYVARGVILSTDGVFEPAELEKFEPALTEISNSTLEDKVRQEILAACQRANWKLGGPRGAAARLGLKRTTLFYKMKRLGITPPADHFQN